MAVENATPVDTASTNSSVHDRTKVQYTIAAFSFDSVHMTPNHKAGSRVDRVMRHKVALKTLSQSRTTHTTVRLIIRKKYSAR